MTNDEIKAVLCKGEWSSFSIDWNDQSGYYQKVSTVINLSPEHYEDDDFVGGAAERQRCIDANSLWTARWYPDTPIGSYVIYASTFETLLVGLIEATKEVYP